MIPQIFYFDFHVGRPDQSPSAWMPYRVKVAALTSAKALDTFCALGFDRSTVMRIEKYMVKALNGATVVQYKFVDFKDTEKLLTGVADLFDSKPVVKASSRKR